MNHKTLFVTFMTAEHAARYVLTLPVTGMVASVDDRVAAITDHADVIDPLALQLRCNKHVCSVHVDFATNHQK